MIRLPMRLVAFWLVTTAVSGLALARGLGSDGGPGAVYTTLGVLGLASLALFLLGWAHRSRGSR